MLWDLDRDEGLTIEASKYLKKFENHPNNTRFKVGQRIEFWTGYHDDIRAVARIKAISGEDIYVYTDCYWFPIKDDAARKIKPWANFEEV